MSSVPKERSSLRPEDEDRAAQYILAEYERRYADRKDRERQWDEVDRQVEMKPVRRQSDPKWIPQVVLPLQAEAHETSVADFRRLMFPADRSFFSAQAALTETDLPRLSYDTFAGTVLGEKKSPVQAMIADRGTQDFANHLPVAFLEKFHGLYNYRDQWDLMGGEAFKYGAYVGRVQMTDIVLRSGKSLRVPCVTALTIREYYLDDSPAKMFQDGIKIGPGMIRHYYLRVPDLKLAAKDKGEGWIPENVADIEAHGKNVPKGHAEMVVFDGDLVFDNGKDTVFIPGCEVTVCKANGKVVRYRTWEFEFSPYLSGLYHQDCVGYPYGTSPLVKGSVIQNAADAALKFMLMAGALNAMPPVRYDPFDQHFAAAGGPVIEPMAMWPSTTKPEPIEIGDMGQQREGYLALLKQYEDLTGVTAPRLGAQTKSHQTAYAVDTEVTRGLTRVVDFVEGVRLGTLNDSLQMEYEMAKTVSAMPVNLPDYGGFVTAAGRNLPETVEFKITGAGTPQEEREEKAARIQSLQAFLQTEGIGRQLGGKPGNVDEVRRQILRIGGWLETDRFLPGPDASGTPAAPPGPTGFLTGGPEVPGLGTGA